MSLTIAYERQRDDQQVEVALGCRIEALVQQLKIPVSRKRSRSRKILRAQIDQHWLCLRKQSRENQCGAREEAAADNPDSPRLTQQRKQPAQRAFVFGNYEALQSRGAEDEPLESAKIDALHPA